MRKHTWTLDDALVAPSERGLAAGRGLSLARVLEDDEGLGGTSGRLRHRLSGEQKAELAHDGVSVG